MLGVEIPGGISRNATSVFPFRRDAAAPNQILRETDPSFKGRGARPTSRAVPDYPEPVGTGVAFLREDAVHGNWQKG